MWYSSFRNVRNANEWRHVDSNVVVKLGCVIVDANPNDNSSYSSHLFPLVDGTFSVVKGRMLSENDASNKRDVEGLLAFRDGITADPMQSLSTWVSTNADNLCSWNGVLCRKRTNRVVAVILPHMGLEGTISPSIGALSLLHIFNLTNNSFTGKIPPELGQLKSLSIIDLSYNGLEGFIPKSLSNCTHLRRIRLSVNNLTGSIPAEYGALRKLEHLRLSYNNLSGRIPISLSNCTSLLKLSIGYNSLTGSIPPVLGSIKGLSYLYFEGNLLTGNIPPLVSNCSELY